MRKKKREDFRPEPKIGRIRKLELFPQARFSPSVSQDLPKFSAVLLAGGKSSRMGSDKALLPLAGGRLLWQRQLQLLQSLGPQRLFVSGPFREGFSAGVDFLSDERPGLGPLGGLAAALQASSSPFLVLLAVDLPAMTTAFLTGLLLQCRQEKGMVLRDKYFEPLAAVYPRAALAIARKRLAGPDLSMQGLVAELIEKGLVQTRALSPEEKPLFKNWNTPEDSAAP
jgi:molybdopterin-guanine dinucleotide biosynthesis protein A